MLLLLLLMVPPGVVELCLSNKPRVKESTARDGAALCGPRTHGPKITAPYTYGLTPDTVACQQLNDSMHLLQERRDITVTFGQEL